VSETIRAGAPISRAEVARRAGLSKPTVSAALSNLLDAGLVQAAGVETGRPGRAGVLFEPILDAAGVLGLDIGAQFVRGAVADLAGGVRARADVPVAGLDADRLLAAAESLTDDLVERAGIARDRIVVGVVGSPGVVDPVTGCLSLAENIPGFDGLALASVVSERLGVDVTVENDVNLAALGEQAEGHGQGVDDFAVVSIGTGVGAGFVLAGRLHRGARGMAGEIEQIPFPAVVPDAVPIDPSAAGIARLAAHLARVSAPSALRPPYEVRAIFAAARADDPLAASVVAETARWVALLIAAIVGVVDVELVVLSGGIGSNPLLLEPVRAEVARRLRYPPAIEVSQLGDGAVLAGALAVARHDALDHVFVNRRVRA
jgi:predicted NBD/HSP70 family sugar kinase